MIVGTGLPIIHVTAMAEGQQLEITRIRGSAEIRQFLESLEFVIGIVILVISRAAENLIVSIRGARFALSREVACNVFGCPCECKEACTR